MFSSCKTTNGNDYLRKVLGNLEKIESATYYLKGEPIQPGDSIPSFINYNFIKEYNNPLDSTIGASYVSLDAQDTTKLNFCYDGNVRVLVYHDVKGIVIDDFTFRPLPFRPLTPPFFNYTKSIIDYALTTTDSIHLDFKDLEDDYYFKLTINEDKQVEFFGKAYHVESSYNQIDPTSIYEIWISKSNDLPYKVRREMSHDISITTCTNVELNKISINDFSAYDYFPADYEIREYGPKKSLQTPKDLVGKKATEWTLNDMNEQAISFTDLKSKVLLINFTGIGCGPCHLSIPFLRELKDSFNNDDFELISIESWNRKPHSLRIYANRHHINYPFLSANDEVLTDYQTGRTAPCFFILDEQRIIRKVIFGYGDNTPDEIRTAISELL